MFFFSVCSIFASLYPRLLLVVKKILSNISALFSDIRSTFLNNMFLVSHLKLLVSDICCPPVKLFEDSSLPLTFIQNSDRISILYQIMSQYFLGLCKLLDYVNVILQ